MKYTTHPSVRMTMDSTKLLRDISKLASDQIVLLTFQGNTQTIQTNVRSGRIVHHQDIVDITLSDKTLDVGTVRVRIHRINEENTSAKLTRNSHGNKLRISTQWP